MRRARISGLDRVVRNLNSSVKKIQGRTKEGLWEAALMIRRRAQQLTPVDTGNLKSSAYTRAYQTFLGPSCEIGFTASYAPFVHEIPGNHRVGQWKFLQTAIEELANDVLIVIEKRARF